MISVLTIGSLYWSSSLSLLSTERRGTQQCTIRSRRQLLRAARRRRRGLALSSATAIFKRETRTPRFFPFHYPLPLPPQVPADGLQIINLGQGRTAKESDQQIKVCPVWGVCQWAEGEEGRSRYSEGRFELGKRIKQPRKIFTAEKSILLEVVGGRVSGELLCSVPSQFWSGPTRAEGGQLGHGPWVVRGGRGRVGRVAGGPRAADEDVDQRDQGGGGGWRVHVESMNMGDADWRRHKFQNNKTSTSLPSPTTFQNSCVTPINKFNTICINQLCRSDSSSRIER